MTQANITFLLNEYLFFSFFDKSDGYTSAMTPKSDQTSGRYDSPPPAYKEPMMSTG